MIYKEVFYAVDMKMLKYINQLKQTSLFLKTVEEDIMEKKITKRPSEQPLPYVAPLSPKQPKIIVHPSEGKQQLHVARLERKVILLSLTYAVECWCWEQGSIFPNCQICLAVSYYFGSFVEHFIPLRNAQLSFLLRLKKKNYSSNSHSALYC